MQVSAFFRLRGRIDSVEWPRHGIDPGMRRFDTCLSMRFGDVHLKSV